MSLFLGSQISYLFCVCGGYYYCFVCHPSGNSDSEGGAHKGDATAGFMSLDQLQMCRVASLWVTSAGDRFNDSL